MDNVDYQELEVLPLDIVRIVFEKAMEDEPPPLHLLRVSHQVRSWLEPLLYHHVSLHSDSALYKFYQTLRAKQNSAFAQDSSFLQRHVQTLFIVSGCPEAHEIVAIIQHLTKLRSLACWDGDGTEWGRTAVKLLLDAAQNEGVFPYANLRRLSFSTSVLEERNVTFAHRTFRDLTHVDFVVRSTVDWESLRSLHNLTHASFDLVTELPNLTTKAIQCWFSRLIAACPLTVKVIILVIVEEYIGDFDLRDLDGDFLYPGWPPLHPDFAMTEDERCITPLSSRISENCSDVGLTTLHPIARIALGIVDPRVVPGALTNWDGTVPRHRDCWMSAEDIIERRRIFTWSELVA
ncbi:hypothetical protein AGABI1DRAFT_105227 [Agaricus bisporus var. burnettii JB137-S8]|uniref:F-box domain-containing protein n=1 Tax=Agaricus bisporus var. burnettii (strain JB137-S8 / ATCC MYA-4627 / FGSC 10392) TaxID=597362 RepID=K5X1R1_AGABU|nr:uncharacterized protein AGABI1DRAFT_105227 [Agaricus bisporus var. burnettii JB137-S8]EKM81746.1 hypothetical protein AGABI1DRAFT_105227 [Agaricus bisporus var. burnettii JB137-S8]